MQSKANKDLYDTISALSGTADFTTTEKSWLLSLANRRLREAFITTDIWPRYLVAYEPRTMKNQVVPVTEDGFYIFGAGTDDVDGLYKLNGTQNSSAAYTVYDSNDVALHSLIYSGSATTWNIIAGVPSSGNAALYTNTTSTNSTTDTANATVEENSWSVVGAGVASAPIVRDLAPIDTFIRAHRTRPFYNQSSTEYDYSVQSDGMHVLNVADTSESKVWVTYKKRYTELTTLDTDGVLGSVEVPLEFFDWLIHSTFTDFLRLDGQTSKAVIEESFAKGLLENEIEVAERVSNNNTVLQRIRTHTSQQARH